MKVRWGAIAAVVVALSLAMSRAVARASESVETPSAARALPVTGGAAVPQPHSHAPRLELGDSLLGRSGKLRARFVPESEMAALFGVAVHSITRTYAVPDGVAGRPFTLLAVRDFSRSKVGGAVGNYHVGYWPAELHAVRAVAYANPAGFVEVTPENQDTYVSEHFRLRDFLTHDQPHVWPKYVVLREALLDKLELVLADLARRGIPASRVRVLSGFRTPAYNLALGDESGRARESRHQYGDAADIIIDSDGDGRMDDLDGDGRVDAVDVRLIELAVERVERAHPELAGGLGVYEAMGPSGPFAHIDVRGESTRWTRGSTRRAGVVENSKRAVPVGSCHATGPSAVLCSRIGRRGS